MRSEELAKLKNMDLSILEYNKKVDKVNSDGFIDKNHPEIKTLRKKYESIIARFDTNINIHKKNGEYILKDKIDTKVIKGIRGLNNTVHIKCEE